MLGADCGFLSLLVVPARGSLRPQAFALLAVCELEKILEFLVFALLKLPLVAGKLGILSLA